MKKPEKTIVIFSGAGISAPSGISTFRDQNGLWDNYKIEEICDDRTWKKNFDKVHTFYNERREQLKNVKPNEGHFGIKRIIDKYGSNNVINITQNIDDMFEQAGCKDIIHVHGNLKKMECHACGKEWEIGYEPFDIEKDRCPKCNSLKGVKPNIVFFYGQAPMYKKMYNGFEKLFNKDSIVIVIGTLGNVVPVEEIIRRTPATKILCNMEKSKYINDNIFDKVYYESIETAITKIEKDVEYYWNS